MLIFFSFRIDSLYSTAESTEGTRGAGQIVQMSPTTMPLAASEAHAKSLDNIPNDSMEHEDITSLRQEISNLKKIIYDEKSKSNNELDILFELLFEKVTKIGRRMQYLESEIDRLEKQNNELESKINRMNIEHQRYEEKEKEHLSLIERLENDLRKARSENDNLKRSVLSGIGVPKDMHSHIIERINGKGTWN